MGGGRLIGYVGCGVVAAVLLTGVACSGGGSESREGPRDPTGEPGAPGETESGGQPGFVVVSGPGGAAVVEGAEVTPLEGVVGPEFGVRGALAVPLPDMAAAVLAEGTLARVTSNGVEATAECRDCSGLAVADGTVVTTRGNGQPGNGFDIVRFGPDLREEDVVPARRLEERITILYTPENTESPVMLAASADRITVGYLSLNGGIKAGPSIVAQYSYDGELLDSVSVDGILSESAVSPDGRLLAVGVGVSGGACFTPFRPVVLRLADLESLDTGPLVPAEVSARAAGSDDPFFQLSDLVWDGPVLHVAGEVFLTGNTPTGGCEVPETWERTVDTLSGAVIDVPRGDVRATRWLGPGCGDTLELAGEPLVNPVAVTRIAGDETVIGPYREVALGQVLPERCG